jgi:hypothetical protein
MMIAMLNLTVYVCKINAKLKAMEEESNTLQKALSIEVESRLKVEGSLMLLYAVYELAAYLCQRRIFMKLLSKLHFQMF